MLLTIVIGLESVMVLYISLSCTKRSTCSNLYTWNKDASKNFIGQLKCVSVTKTFLGIIVTSLTYWQMFVVTRPSRYAMWCGYIWHCRHCRWANYIFKLISTDGATFRTDEFPHFNTLYRIVILIYSWLALLGIQCI